MSQAGRPPRRASDLEDFGRCQELREALRAEGGGVEVHSSPDGRHLLLLRRDRRLLQAFDRIPSPAAPHRPRGRLQRSWAPLQPSVAGLLFLEGSGPAWVLAVVWENGQAEVWGYREEEDGWSQRQSLELCISPRARVVAVCSHRRGLTWCEERPPSGASLASAATLGYCVCHRDLELRGPQLILGPMKILLHHSPRFQLLASPQHVYLLPSTPTNPSCISKTLLVWAPAEGKVRVVAPSTGAIHSTGLTLGDSDFKNLLFKCLGLMPSIEHADIQSFALSRCGGLLLVTQRGVVSLLQPEGTLRRVYDFGGSPLDPEELVQMQIFGGTLVCFLSGVLYLINSNIGRLREKKILSTNKILFMPPFSEGKIQFLTHTGIYEIALPDIPVGGSGSDPVLVEMVYEEACKYYQQRSLGNTTLTVESLKEGGMFQAPLALSSILQSRQNAKIPADHRGQFDKLMHTINADIEIYLSLKHLKSCIISLSETDTEQYCENLVDQEIIRLLNSGLESENMVYMNYLFNTFPHASWKSISRCLQLQQNGVGQSIDKAVLDVWKKILVPIPSMSQEAAVNGVLPLFELICQSMYSYKPKGLASFVAKAQQYVGVHWNYSNNCEVNPLYKRAMSVLEKRRFNTTASDDTDIEVDILLCSERPTAVTQAVNLLIQGKRWGKVVEVAARYLRVSPVVHKDVFTIFLIEFAQHRELDPYLDQVWEMCPQEMKATEILNIVLKHIPSSADDCVPFSSHSGDQVTIGLLRPLLNKVLQFRSSSDGLFDDKLHTPSFPPQTPPREHRIMPKTVSEH
ncbi:hypothetical protein NDU88_007277 [Pleurodeles waltl]|uniref:Uncharacterized protein n=1 Tax=Pleurodeles waltl TaxID=8319 RepID=A0AAV7QLJ9_PLEWA|nr:hypothetical protein NDU88_007277 [Pleurodeles waltl]